MKLSEIEVSNLSQNQITQILFGNARDDKKQGDCIFTILNIRQAQNIVAQD